MLWRGRVLWGMMMFDELRALNYLASRPEVDPTRLGVTGMSMGSTKAWWLAALDPRVRLSLRENRGLIASRNELLSRPASGPGHPFAGTGRVNRGGAVVWPRAQVRTYLCVNVTTVG